MAMEKENRSVPDIVDFDLTKDGDVCNTDELKSLYQQSYFCAARKAVGLDKLFIMHMDVHWQTDRLACALSNNSIHLTTIDTLTKLDTFLVHDQNIVDVRFSPVDPNCLYTGSNDGKIRTWDLRTTKKHTQEFKDDSDKSIKPLLSFDVNNQGQILGAGTEKIRQDAFILFWDIRSSDILKIYSDSHDDDVSHVQFHPEKADTLASCSTDCLINIFDTGMDDEENALQNSLNSGTSCGRLQWLNSSTSKTENLSVLTHTEDVQIWDVAEADLRCSFSRDEIKESLKRRQTETCYAIRCFQMKNDAEPLILAGSSTPNRGCLRVLKLHGSKLEPYAILDDDKGTNSQIVRCAQLNVADGTILSAGEDGIINVWKPGHETPVTTKKTNESVQFSTTKASTSRSKKPYSKR